MNFSNEDYQFRDLREDESFSQYPRFVRVQSQEDGNGENVDVEDGGEDLFADVDS